MFKQYNINDVIILEYKKGNPFFKIVLEHLNYLDSYTILVKDILSRARIEDRPQKIATLSSKLHRMKEKAVSFLHEVHHLNLDWVADEFVEWVKYFPDISKKIIKHKNEHDVYGYPIDEWYQKIRNRKNLNVNWWEIVINFRFHEFTGEKSALNHLAWLCRENFYTISSYNLANYLIINNKPKYSEIETKIQQAYELYKKAK